MARYRICGGVGVDAGGHIDHFILADSDQGAIALAKTYPVRSDTDSRQWARLSDHTGKVLWEVGEA
jgi:hypothetical protein